MWTTIMPIVPGEEVCSYSWRQGLVNSLPPTTHARRDAGRWTTPAWGLPTGLARYASTYGAQLRLPRGEDWIREHTLAPYYFSTLTLQRQVAFQARLLEYQPGPRRPLLPIAANEWFSLVPKLCPACDDEHMATLGFSIVMRQWLLPFATRCAVHGEILRQYPAWTPVGRADSIPIEVKPLRRNQGVALAMAGCNALRTGESLLEVLGGLLQSRGFVSAAGRIRRKALSVALQIHAENRYEHPHLDVLLSNLASVARLLAPLWNPRTCMHPAVAYALMQALQDAKESAQKQLWPLPSTRSERLKNLARALDNCVTLTDAAKQAGVSVTTAAVQAQALGLSFSHRPKKLDSHLRRWAEELLRSGKLVDEVARSTGLSSVSVYRVLRANPQLKTSLARSKKDEQIEARRKVWLEAAQVHPEASRKQLRDMAPAAYAYLYRWDRAWLSTHSTERKLPSWSSSTRALRAPPGAQDELLARLKNLATVNAMELPPRLTPTRLLKAAGRANSGQANQTAQLQETLDALTETLRMFVRRRLSASAARLHNAHMALTPSAVERESRLRPETIRRSGLRTEVVLASTRSKSLKFGGS